MNVNNFERENLKTMEGIRQFLLCESINLNAVAIMVCSILCRVFKLTWV